MENRGVDFLLGFITGALVGAAVALIFAPQSGEETREYLKEKVSGVKEKVEEFATEVKGKVSDLSTKAKGVPQKIKEVITKGRVEHPMEMESEEV